MRVCGIFLAAGSRKRLSVAYVPRGNWAYRLEFKLLCKSVELALNRCDVFQRLLLGIPPLTFKVAHYPRPANTAVFSPAVIIFNPAFCRISHCKDTTCSTF